MQETPRLAPGSRFGADFTILSRIGAGGMASVYEAREEPLGRIVALKVLDRDSEPALRARFLAEARTMASIRHPNVAEVFRFGTDAGTGLPFLAMERFPGSLADRLSDSRTLPEAETAALGVALSGALSALHGRNPPLVHRDVKPSNILVSGDGRPVLADFGLVRRLAPDATALTAPDAGQPGTWLYAAPEQRAGAPPSPAADWYAFGVTLFRALAGGFPGPGGELPRDVAAEVSRAWRPLLRGLLASDPAARLADPAAIRAALSRIASGCRRRDRRRRLLRAAALLSLAGAALAGAATAVGVAFPRHRPRDAGDADRRPEGESVRASPPFPAKDWAGTYAETLRKTLDAAIDVPEPDAGNRIVVPSGAILLSGDVPSSGDPPAILLDGGTLLFSPGAAVLGGLLARCETFLSEAPDDASEVPPVLPSRKEWFANAIHVTERGGRLDTADGDITAFVTNAIRRAPGAGSAELSVFGLSSIVLERRLLDPGLTVTGSGQTAEFLPDGRMRARRWFEEDNPLEP